MFGDIALKPRYTLTGTGLVTAAFPNVITGQVLATDSTRSLTSLAYDTQNTAFALVQRSSNGGFSAGPSTFKTVSILNTGTSPYLLVSTSSVGSTNQAQIFADRADQANGSSIFSWSIVGTPDWNVQTVAGSSTLNFQDATNTVNVLTLTKGSGTSSDATFAGTVRSNGGIGLNVAPIASTITFANSTSSPLPRLVLFSVANNDHQYLGYGISASTLRYQVPDTSTDHVFFAATSSSASNELLRVKGNGNINIPGSTASVGVRVAASSRFVFDCEGTLTSTDGTFMACITAATTMSPSVSSTNAVMLYAYPNISPVTSTTITNAIGLYVDSGATGGAGTTTNGYGIYINNPGFGTNKYCAYFGGNVGIGISTPGSLLTINASGVSTSGTAASLLVNGAGSTTNAGATANFSSGSSSTAGNIYGISVEKFGTEVIYMGVNKNTTTGSVPANACFISTYTSSGKMAIGRGAANSLPSTADILLNGDGTVTFGSSITTTGDATLNSGFAIVNTAGKTLKVKQGSNSCFGTGAVLVGGTVTVSTTAVATGDTIFLSCTAAGGTQGIPRISAISNGTSFTITSSNGADTSTYSWLIIKAA